MTLFDSCRTILVSQQPKTEPKHSEELRAYWREMQRRYRERKKEEEEKDGNTLP